MAELGQTGDPVALVPGDVGSIYRTVSALRTYGDLLHLAGQGLQRIDTTDGWSGAAADAFRAAYHGQPGNWLRAGDAFHTAATAMDDYAATLSWAQRQAAEAISVWNSGRANQPAAQEILARARNTLTGAGDSAAATVGKARDLAPPQPSFWPEVGSFFSNLGHEAERAGESALNGLASIGNAMAHHPGDVVATIGGLALAGFSGVGDGLGVVLDATGVGAVAGVPLNAVSTAGVVGGLGIAGAGLADIMRDAAGPDRATVMHSDSATGGGATPRSYTSNVGKISNDLGYPPREINDAIHSVKAQGGWRGLGGNKNPDVVVDTSTGEVYPKLPGGNVSGDSIGNIFDYLPEE